MLGGGCALVLLGMDGNNNCDVISDSHVHAGTFDVVVWSWSWWCSFFWWSGWTFERLVDDVEPLSKCSSIRRSNLSSFIFLFSSWYNWWKSIAISSSPITFGSNMTLGVNDDDDDVPLVVVMTIDVAAVGTVDDDSSFGGGGGGWSIVSQIVFVRTGISIYLYIHTYIHLCRCINIECVDVEPIFLLSRWQCVFCVCPASGSRIFRCPCTPNGILIFYILWDSCRSGYVDSCSWRGTRYSAGYKTLVLLRWLSYRY